MTTETFMTTGTATHSLQDSRRRFTVDAYYRMADIGILGPDDRVELLDGQVVQMSPIGNRHSVCVAMLTKLFSEQAGKHAELWVQSPVSLDEFNEPEPDVALVRAPLTRYLPTKPGPDDVFLIVEVSDTSATADRDVKLPIYARAGFPEVWLVDLQAGRVDVHRNPTGHTYAEVTRVKPPAKVQPAAFPDVLINTARLFPR